MTHGPVGPLLPVVLYVRPYDLMPVAPAIAAAVGVALVFWRRTLRSCNASARPSSACSADAEPAPHPVRRRVSVFHRAVPLDTIRGPGSLL